jgi:hypothetical protein
MPALYLPPSVRGHKMKKLKYIETLLICFMLSCSNQEYVFNDWSELNLKNEPKEIVETSSFSPNELLLNPDSFVNWYLIQPINIWFTYTTYSFDSAGFIINKEFHDPSISYPDYNYLGEKIYSREIFDDSVVIIRYFKLIPENSTKETYVLDHKGIPFKKIKLHSNQPWVIDSFARDKNNRVTTIKSKYLGINDCSEYFTLFSYNEHGDPYLEIKYETSISKDTLYGNDTTMYKYIYDEYDNWILMATFKNDTITKITQRTIKY